jgi:hypothetical protein
MAISHSTSCVGAIKTDRRAKEQSKDKIYFSTRKQSIETVLEPLNPPFPAENRTFQARESFTKDFGKSRWQELAYRFAPLILSLFGKIRS